jgi:hypothetical protein
MIEKSTCFLIALQRVAEWCDCNKRCSMEWTQEAGKKGLNDRVIPNGILARYQGDAYDST